MGKKKQLGTRIALTTIPFISYILAYFHVPLPQNSEGSRYNFPSKVILRPDDPTQSGFFTNALVRMNVLGTFILGLLSGFGAVSTAWSFQPFATASYVRWIRLNEILTDTQGKR
jgi:hypothetical protein